MIPNEEFKKAKKRKDSARGALNMADWQSEYKLVLNEVTEQNSSVGATMSIVVWCK